MELSVRRHRHNAAALLSSVLKGVQAIICQACSILNTIYAKHTTLVMQLVVSEFTTLTHLSFVLLFSSKVCHCVMEQRLLAGIVVNILEEILLETLGMSHLSKDLSVAADDTLDRII